MKKSEITEILDSEGNLIGSDDKPQNNPNEISADGTTDRNAGIHSQHFGNTYLGRFGFYYESEDKEPLNLKIAKASYNFFDSDDGLDGRGWEGLGEDAKNNYISFADGIVSLFKPQNDTPESTLSESELASIIEDVVTKRKDDSSLTNKKIDNDLLSDKFKKIKTLFTDLSDREKGDLIKQLK